MLMPKCVERLLLWMAGKTLTFVLWPLVVVSTAADLMTEIDPRWEDA